MGAGLASFGRLQNLTDEATSAHINSPLDDTLIFKL